MPNDPGKLPVTLPIDWETASSPITLSGPAPDPSFAAPPIEPAQPARPTPAERDAAVDTLVRLLTSGYEHIALGAASRLLDLAGE